MSILKKFLNRTQTTKQDSTQELQKLKEENEKLNSMLKDIDENFMTWYESQEKEQTETQEETVSIKELIKEGEK